MSYRAAIILIEKGQIALVERYRQGLHYFTFPGGHVEPDETPEQAAIRETEEELGLEVVIERLVAEIWWHEKPQYYYLVKDHRRDIRNGHGRGNDPSAAREGDVYAHVDASGYHNGGAGSATVAGTDHP